MKRHLDDEADDGPTVQSPRRRRSNVLRREPLAEIISNDEKEVRRSKRRKNKRVSFSETTTIAMFIKDNNRELNESNDNEKSQLINQFQVAAETIEGVLDVSGQGDAVKNDFNATMIDGRDMSLLSDSSQSESVSNSAGTVSSSGTESDDSFRNAKGLLGEMDMTMRSSKPASAKPVESKFETTVFGGEDMSNATMLSSDSMSFVTDSFDTSKLMDATKLDASMNITTMNMSIRDCGGLLKEFDTSDLESSTLAPPQKSQRSPSMQHEESTGSKSKVDSDADTSTKHKSNRTPPHSLHDGNVSINLAEVGISSVSTGFPVKDGDAGKLDNDVNEPRRSKRRNKKRVSFSDTKSVALFAKDNSGELNVSANNNNNNNNNTQLVNQLKVVPKAMETVRDESCVSAHNFSIESNFNVSVTNEGVTLVLTDSSLSSEDLPQTASDAHSEDSPQTASDANKQLNDTNMEFLAKISAAISPVTTVTQQNNELGLEVTVYSEKEMCDASTVSAKSLSFLTDDSSMNASELMNTTKMNASELMDTTKVNASMNLTMRGFLNELDASLHGEQLKDASLHGEQLKDADAAAGAEPSHLNMAAQLVKDIFSESTLDSDADVLDKHSKITGAQPECSLDLAVSNVNVSNKSQINDENVSNKSQINDDSVSNKSHINDDKTEKEPRRSKRGNNKRVSFSDKKSVASFAKDYSEEVNISANNNTELVNQQKVTAKTTENVLDESWVSEHNNSVSKHNNSANINFNVTTVDEENLAMLADTSQRTRVSELSGKALAENRELDNSANVELLANSSTLKSPIMRRSTLKSPVTRRSTLKSPVTKLSISSSAEATGIVKENMSDASVVAENSLSLVLTDVSMDVSDVFTENSGTEVKCDSPLNSPSTQNEAIEDVKNISMKIESDTSQPTGVSKPSGKALEENKELDNTGNVELLAKSSTLKSPVMRRSTLKSPVNSDIHKFKDRRRSRRSIHKAVEANSVVNVSAECEGKIDYENNYVPSDHVDVIHVGDVGNDGDVLVPNADDVCDSGITEHTDDIKIVATELTGDSGVNVSTQCLENIDMESCFKKFEELLGENGEKVVKETASSVLHKEESIADVESTEYKRDVTEDYKRDVTEEYKCDVTKDYKRNVTEESKEVPDGMQNVEISSKSDAVIQSSPNCLENENADSGLTSNIDVPDDHVKVARAETESSDGGDLSLQSVENVQIESSCDTDSTNTGETVTIRTESTGDSGVNTQTGETVTIRTESTGDSGVNVSSLEDSCAKLSDSCAKLSFTKNVELLESVEGAREKALEPTGCMEGAGGNVSLDGSVLSDGLNQSMNGMKIDDVNKSCANVSLSKRRASLRSNRSNIQVFDKDTVVNNSCANISVSKRRASSRLNLSDVQVFDKDTVVTEVKDFQLQAADFRGNVVADKTSVVSLPKAEQEKKTYSPELHDSSNEIPVEQKLVHSDTSWLSHEDLQEFQDSGTEAEETVADVTCEDRTEKVDFDKTNQIYDNNLNAEVENLVKCFSQNSLTIENWETVKDETVSEKIASTMSRITRLKAQNKLYNSQNQSYRQHSISEKSLNYTPSKVTSDTHKFEYTIVKASDVNSSCMSSDSWMAEPTASLPIANSSRIPAVPPHVDNEEKDCSVEEESIVEIKEEMKQNDFPPLCIIAYEDHAKLIITVKKYTCHKFIIKYCKRRITDIIAERTVPQWMDAEDFMVSFMYNAMNIPKLKNDFTAVSQIPDLLRSICSSIKKWIGVARDIYHTFYKFLGRVKLEEDRIVVKFFVDKIWDMFSLVIKFDTLAEPFSACWLSKQSSCQGVFDAVKDTLRSAEKNEKMPLLSSCEHIEYLCIMLAEGSMKVGERCVNELGKEVNLDIDLFNTKIVL